MMKSNEFMDKIHAEELRHEIAVRFFKSSDPEEAQKELNEYIKEHQNEIDVIYDVHTDVITEQDWGGVGISGLNPMPILHPQYLTKYVVSLSYKVKQEV